VAGIPLSSVEIGSDMPSEGPLGGSALERGPPALCVTMTNMELSRIAWLTTVGICIFASALLLLSDYYGYAGVLAAVGLSAAINLR
jgi:hypothetical protein